jgi:RmuC family
VRTGLCAGRPGTRSRPGADGKIRARAPHLAFAVTACRPERRPAQSEVAYPVTEVGTACQGKSDGGSRLRGSFRRGGCSGTIFNLSCSVARFAKLLVDPKPKNVSEGGQRLDRDSRKVGDLNRILTSVKARGMFGEGQLELLLDEFLTPEQYVKNAQIRGLSIGVRT